MLPSLEEIDWRGFLARPALPPPTPEALDALHRQPILITGAGGSIGSALALRLAALASPLLLLLESSESHLYALERDLTESGAACPTMPLLGNVSDRALLDHVFAEHAPRLAFHAAAFKHVPLMEAHPLAAISNNIFATQVLADVAAAHGARLLLLSTDKAVAPASVMGATKRVAERIVLAHGGTVLRLANVLATRDSVAEIFARQIAQGGPLTVTGPRARRYFLTLDEAVNLLLTAAAIPPPTLLAPILPASYLISDLARFMARELAPNHEIPIVFTGPRSGDKESERLWSDDESTQPLCDGPIVSIQSDILPKGRFDSELHFLRAALEARDLDTALDRLCALVPDYTPSPAVLVQMRPSLARGLR